jgi:hypothetical protein
MSSSGVYKLLKTSVVGFHNNDSGVAMTEYILVFTVVSMASVMAIVWTAAYVKAYRDFLIWWLAHPAV